MDGKTAAPPFRAVGFAVGHYFGNMAMMVCLPFTANLHTLRMLIR